MEIVRRYATAEIELVAKLYNDELICNEAVETIIDFVYNSVLNELDLEQAKNMMKEIANDLDNILADVHDNSKDEALKNKLDKELRNYIRTLLEYYAK